MEVEMEGWAEVPTIFLLEITRNVQIYAEKLCFYTPTLSQYQNLFLLGIP